MPRRDGTGPMGIGTMRGRGLGLCNGETDGTGFGRRSGRGRGMKSNFECRRGFGRTFANETSVLSDEEVLSEQRELLQKRLDVVNRQLEDMSTANK